MTAERERESEDAEMRILRSADLGWMNVFTMHAGCNCASVRHYFYLNSQMI